ncbi:MAG: hypothetical protein NPIRA04_12330 [Nitrospirales bacterium]|nr:MAG: hypothetical protein NPIRA04_12330 [Nitrospirales bacterium]
MSQNAQPDLPLPPLRDDIQVVKGMPTLQGESTWTMIDPIRNTYFQIGWGAFQILSRWNAGTPEQLVKRVEAETTYPVIQEEVQAFIAFLYDNHLTQQPQDGGTASFIAKADADKQHWLKALMHHYLFFKIPLVRPDHLLRATLPYITPLMTNTFAAVILGIGLLGLYLVSRQWETFTNTFVYLFTWEGMAALSLALCGIKILHELGHAYTTTRYGCRVHTMGVAFLVLFPVLYTDTTDTWRLTSRRQRLFIGAAGIITELGIAMCATFLWNFLPDGMIRSMAFILATTSWMMSLTINLNPLLRFDGYYLLSDFLGIPNLQQRAFAFGCWKLRELLFGLDMTPPEQTTPRVRHILILYAWSVWVFRFFLFLGIAVLVYYFFFKLLGIILFALEIVYFIIRPIVHEILVWWKLRAHTRRPYRAWISAALLTLTVMALCIPWQTRVAIPAIRHTKVHTTIFAPGSAQVMEAKIRNGQTVSKGEILAQLDSPDIQQQLHQTHTRIEALTLQLRTRTKNPKGLADTHVLNEELNTERSKYQGLLEMHENLELKAPFSGIVVDVQSSLHPERWINEQLPLARIIQPDHLELVALTPETELSRLQIGQIAAFIPDDLTRPIEQATITDIRHVDEATLDIPYLASVFGGNIPVREDADGNLLPETAMYRVTLTPQPVQLRDNQVVKGLVHVQGNPQSLIERIRDLIMRVLIREMGF